MTRITDSFPMADKATAPNAEWAHSLQCGHGGLRVGEFVIELNRFAERGDGRFDPVRRLGFDGSALE